MVTIVSYMHLLEHLHRLIIIQTASNEEDLREKEKYERRHQKDLAACDETQHAHLIRLNLD